MQSEFLELDPAVPEQKKEKKVRADGILQADLAVLILFLLLYVFLPLFTDGNTAGFFLPSFLVILAGYLLYPLALSKPVSIHVMRRVNRDQTEGLSRALSKLSFGCVLSGIVMGPVLTVFQLFVSEQFFHVKSAMLPAVVAGAVFFLSSLQTVPGGFLAGAGQGRKVIIAHVIRVCATLIAGVPLSVRGAIYGEKTDALLHTQTGIYTYGALGIALGFLLGVLISGFYLLIAYLRGVRKIEQELESAIRPEIVDAPSEHLRFPYAFSALLIVIMIMSGLLLYVLLQPLEGDALAHMALLNGIFSRAVFLQCALGLVLCLFFVRGAYRMSAMITKNDIASARSLYKHLRFFIVFYTLPISAIIAVLAESMMRVFERYPQPETVMAARISAVFVLTLPMIVFGTLTFLRIRKYIILYFNAAAVLAVFFVLFFILSFLLKRSVAGALGAGALACALWAFLLYGTTSVMLGIRIRLFRDLFKYVIAALVGGVMAFVLNAILLPVIGEILTIAISAFIGFGFYFIVLIVLRAISVPDLYHLPFGDRIVPLLRRLHLVV